MPSLTKVQTGFVEAQGALPLSSGTAAAPGLKFSDHDGTGMFSPSTGVIAFSTSGLQQALSIHSNGELISANGTLRRNVSDSSFTVSGDTASNTGANINLYGASHSTLANVFRVRNGSTETLRVNSAGNIGIGNDGDFGLYTAADDRNLILGTGSSSSGIQIHSSTTGYGGVYFGDTTSGTARYTGYMEFKHGTNDDFLRFGTSSGEKLRIDSSGRLLKSGQAALTSTSLNHPIQVAAASDANAIAIIGRAADDIAELSYYEADKSTKLGEVQYRQDHANIRHRVGDIRFATGGTTERLRIFSDGNVRIGDDSISVATVGSGPTLAINGTTPEITLRDDASGNPYAVMRTNDYGSLTLEADQGNAAANSTIHFRVDNTERMRINSSYLLYGDTASDLSSTHATMFCGTNHAFQYDGNSGTYLRFILGAANGTVDIEADARSGGYPDLRFITYNDERLRITSGGNIRIGGANGAAGALLHLRDSDNTTQGTSQLKISKGVGSGAAPATTSRSNCYIHLGSSEWGSGANGQYLMGFGYTNGETGTGIPAYIGFKETTTSGYTQGDLIFGTRNNTTGTSNAEERLRIRSNGDLILGPYDAPGSYTSSAKNVPYQIKVAPFGWQHHSEIAAISMGAHQGTGQDDGEIVFKTAENVHSSTTGLQERMRITSNGIVNIGGNYTQTNYTAQVTRVGGNTDVMQVKGNTQNSFIRFTDNDASSDYSFGADDGPGVDNNNLIIYDRNALAYRFILSSNGCITTPGQPAFLAWKNQLPGVSVLGTFDFNQAAFNIGGHYNTSNYRFTAPITGTYQFNFNSIVSASNVSNGGVYFYKNGAVLNQGGMIHWSVEFSNTRWHNVSYSPVVYLNANDYIEVRNGSVGANYHGNHWSQFAGYLVG